MQPLVQAQALDVMVVEDDPPIRETLCELLREQGYRVASAADGADALRKLAGQPTPRLILLDLSMPVMNGWQFRRAQLRDPALAPVPVVVISADRDLEPEVRALSAAGYLPKPFDLDVLLATVDRFCAGAPIAA